jgi:hypothetical protein
MKNRRRNDTKLAKIQKRIKNSIDCNEVVSREDGHIFRNVYKWLRKIEGEQINCSLKSSFKTLPNYLPHSLTNSFTCLFSSSNMISLGVVLLGSMKKADCIGNWKTSHVKTTFKSER